MGAYKYCCIHDEQREGGREGGGGGRGGFTSAKSLAFLISLRDRVIAIDSSSNLCVP